MTTETFPMPVEFRALLRGLAATHLIDCEVQFRNLQRMVEPGDARLIQAKEVFDEARRFNALMNPMSASAQASAA
jgi:hypothetical protein